MEGAEYKETDLVGSGYGAFLQNAEVWVMVNPERCSGLVYGVPLGHGRRRMLLR